MVDTIDIEKERALKIFMSIVLALAGVVLAAYVAIWIFFIGGIENVINGVRAEPVDAGQVAWGLAEVFILAELSGVIIFWTFAGLAAWLGLRNDRPRLRRTPRATRF